jgi:precorrin-6B methylase 2
MRTWPLTRKDVLGVGVVPPAAATRAASALRGRVGALHDRLALPFQVLLERLLGALDGPALAAAVDLGLAQHLDRPRTAADVAARAGADPDRVERLCAYLAARGCLRRDRRGRYRANGVTRLLRDDGWAGWVRFAASPWSYGAFARLTDGVRAGTDPMEAAHGVAFFDYLSAHPDAAAAFHDAQAAGARMQSVLLADALDVRGVRSVCDVGGGTGSLVAQLLATHPHLRATVLDRAEAEPGARATFADAGVADRAEFVAGDFFAAVPPGHDLHVLTAVVHDWGDDDVVRILGRCTEALAPGGRIAVVEPVLAPGSRASFAQLTDVLMLAYTPGGRERTAAQLDVLWRRAGLRCTRDHELPSLFHVFELVPA